MMRRFCGWVNWTGGGQGTVKLGDEQASHGIIKDGKRYWEKFKSGEEGEKDALFCRRRGECG